MAEGTTKDDPFNWEVDRVIKELCTTDRTWRPTPNAKLPDPVMLAEKLRDGEFDGELLLLSTEKDLWKHLSITKPKPQAALRCAINQFKRRSDNYKKWMKFIDDPNDNTESDNDNNQPYRQQSDALQQAFTPVSDIGGPASAQLAETAPNDAEVMELEQDLAEPEPPSKKRRLALTAMVTTDRSSLPQGQYFNIATIPTEADNMSFIPAEADNTSFTVDRPGNVAPLLNQAQSVLPNDELVSDQSKGGELLAEDVEVICISKPGAYWGNGKLLKSDILSRPTMVDDDPDVEFGWGRPKPFGKARKRYVRGIVQRHLLYPERRIAPKKDPVLPAYGESDNDADASEWDEVNREIQEEEEEARLEKEQALGLEPSEVDACLEKMIEECTAIWHDTKLPKEKHKAHKLWHEVRRNGTRRTEVQFLLTKLREAEKSLEKTLQHLKDNHYSSEAELRLMSPLLEPRVMPIAHIKWLVRIFSSPNAPEKVARPEAPVQREPKPRSAEDSIDIWSEDELEDPMHDFIVDDVSAQELDAPRDDPPELPMDVMDVDQSVTDSPADPTQSFTPSTDENIEMHDLTNIDHDSDVNDQVLPSLVIPRRSKPVPSTSHASPDSEDPPLSDWRAIVQKGCAHWESKRDVKRLMINIIWTQPPAIRKGMFKTVNSLERDDFWIRVIERHSRKEDGSFKKVEVQDMIFPHSLHLLRRLFRLHVRAYSSSSLPLRELDDIPSLKWAIENKHHFGSFWEFLRSIVVRPGPPPSDNAQVQLTPAAQRKQRKRQYEDEQDASKQFREMDLRRQREQQARRLHLRKQVQGSEISQEQSRLIINESKLDGQNLVYIHPHIAPLIKDHQIDGVRFMWDQILSDSNQGCLLAHTMGLGKTMQVITLLTAIQDAATSSDPKVSCQIPDHLKKSSTLILCPSGLLNNWMDELLYWSPEGLLGELFSVEATLSEEERAATVQDWAQRGGVLIIGYTMLTQIAARENVLQLLLNKPSIVISDEAHTLKNQTSKISEIASRFQTHSRLALTGSPLANNVGEYYAMIEWVAPDFLGDKKGFNIAYTTPIAEGLYEDSSKAQRRKAKIRLAALRTLVAPKVHRRTVATLKDSLPPKKEFIIHVDIGSVQKDAYLTYLTGIQGKLKSDEEEVDVTSMWSLIKTLGPLLAHPSLLDAKLRDLQRRREKPQTKKGAKNGEGSVEVLPPQVVSDTLKALTAHQGYKELKTSFKMLALFKILDEAMKLGENVLVFSQSLHTLDFIQDVCIQQHKPFKRLDGSTKVAGRQSQVFKNQLASGVVDKKDLLPKARQLRQYFAEPQQLQHEDLSAYRGRDSILDALIASSETSEGISSICTTETFEEEDTQRLPDEDQREAEDLARRSAKKMYPADEQVHYYHAPQQGTEEAPFAGYPHQAPSPQFPMGGQYPVISPAARAAPNAFTPVPYRQYNANQTVNHFAPVHNDRAPHRNQHYAMQHPPVQANGEPQLAQLSSTPGPGNAASAQSPPTDSTFSFGAMSHGVQLGGRPIVTDGGTHHGALAAAAPGDATPPQGMSPMTLGTTQMGHAPTTAGSGNASLLQDNAPIMMDATSRRDSSSASDAGARFFRRELERQAPAQFRHQVPMVMTQLVQHLTGGQIQRNVAWNALGNHIQNRPDRAEAILRGLVLLDRVAEYSRTSNPELGSLLDGAKPPSPPQGSRDTKDPDHTQRMLQRSISNAGKQDGESTRKAQDYAALREVLKKREPKSQKPQKPQKPEKPEKPRKVKSEKAERRRRTMSVVGPGSATDPVVIDD
ncbi:hypothetical protein VMCG_07103 [Cytospora schulzeri]|uniref:Helicase ATP-binding domain-containing protein n=1 Tax=Cytospora schulzeri TaxID=448051 RepID=A0A423W4Z5_9PEZI|nr:hypothetical protein VMCG_07103 [Valsa malicola]